MPEPHTQDVRPDRERVQPVRHGPACGRCCLPARPLARALVMESLKERALIRCPSPDGGVRTAPVPRFFGATPFSRHAIDNAEVRTALCAAG
jgi:hypothetical protein